MKIKHYLMLCIICLTSISYGQESHKWSVQFSSEKRTLFENIPLDDDTPIAPSLSQRLSVLYYPKEKWFFYKLGFGYTSYSPYMERTRLSSFVDYYDLPYQITDKDEQLYAIVNKYDIQYLDFSLGIRHILRDYGQIKFHHDLDIVNYFRLNVDSDVEYKKWNTGSTNYASISNGHPTREQFRSNDDSYASPHMIDLNYTMGFMMHLGNRIGLGGFVKVTMSRTPSSISKITESYSGFGLGANLLIKL